MHTNLNYTLPLEDLQAPAQGRAKKGAWQFINIDRLLYVGKHRLYTIFRTEDSKMQIHIPHRCIRDNDLAKPFVALKVHTAATFKAKITTPFFTEDIVLDYNSLLKLMRGYIDEIKR